MRRPDPSTLALIGLVVLLFGVWWTGYDGRLEVVKSQRVGCERGKLDRAANAKAWREAQYAETRDADPGSAAIYKSVAEGLEERSLIVCAEAFPSPSLVPLP